MGGDSEVQALVYVLKHRSDARAIVGLLLLKASDATSRLPLGVPWATRHTVRLHDASRERPWAPGQPEYELRRERQVGGRTVRERVQARLPGDAGGVAARGCSCVRAAALVTRAVDFAGALGAQLQDF